MMNSPECFFSKCSLTCLGLNGHWILCPSFLKWQLYVTKELIVSVACEYRAGYWECGKTSETFRTYAECLTGSLRHAKKVTYIVWTDKKFQTVNVIHDSVAKGGFFWLFCFISFFNNSIRTRANWKGKPLLRKHLHTIGLKASSRSTFVIDVGRPRPLWMVPPWTGGPKVFEKTTQVSHGLHLVSTILLWPLLQFLPSACCL